MENDTKDPVVDNVPAAEPVAAQTVSDKPVVAKKVTPRKATAKKATAKKATAKKATAKKATAKKVVAKKPIAKKVNVKKAAVKKSVVKKPSAKKGTEPAAVRAPVVETVPPQKSKKVKLVRDSFTMPGNEYQILQDLKKASLKAGIEVKKSELLRIGVGLLKSLTIPQLAAERAALTKLQAGRPKK